MTSPELEQMFANARCFPQSMPKFSRKSIDGFTPAEVEEILENLAS